MAAPGFAPEGGSGVATFKAGGRPPHPSPQMNADVGSSDRHWGQILNTGGTAPHSPHYGAACGHYQLGSLYAALLFTVPALIPRWYDLCCFWRSYLVCAYLDPQLLTLATSDGGFLLQSAAERREKRRHWRVGNLNRPNVTYHLARAAVHHETMFASSLVDLPKHHIRLGLFGVSARYGS